MVDSRIMRSLGIVIVLVGSLAVGNGAQAKPGAPKKYPRAPNAEILTQITILNDKIDDLAAVPPPDAIGPCDVPPVWGKKYAGADRFVAVLDGAAYCDQETGLVWDGSPDITGGESNNGRIDWDEAISHCANREVDGRKGFHLPMREQLASLVDPTGTSGVTLPDGHPFLNVQLAGYWSATTLAHFPLSAWVVDFRDGEVRDNHKDGFLLAWCVRGGQSYDGQDVDEVMRQIAITHP